MGSGREEIERGVLKRITPTAAEKEEMGRVVAELLTRISDAAHSLDISAEGMVVGSAARDTYLRSDTDIDLFLLFDPTTSRAELERQGLGIGRRVLDSIELRYAEHPYTHGIYRGYEVDLVPCYRVPPGKRITAVDRTPAHHEYVQKHLKGKQRDHVRLLKRFLRGLGVYGAEAAVEGFSGYLCELLILRYGSFSLLVKAAGGWRPPVTIPSGEYEFDNPLIVIDPVDPKRNVASAVSLRSFALFVEACNAYRNRPTEKFFFPEPISPWSPQQISQEMEGRGYWLAICFPTPPVVEDVLYPQVKKCARKVVELCERYDFRIAITDCYVDKKEVLVLLGFEVSVLPSIRIHRGPPVWCREASERFRKKWADSYMAGERWVVDVAREYINPKRLLEQHIQGIDLGPRINALKEQVEMLEGEAIIIPSYLEFLTSCFDRRPPWER